MNKFLCIGSLVRTNSGTKQHHGRMGIVVNSQCWGFEPYEKELVITVLYPETGEEVEWTERSLELVN